MELKLGYKQTEVGVIPEVWEASRIGDFAFVTKLAGFEYTLHFDYSKSGPVIAVRALNIKNAALDLTDVHTIPRGTSDALPRSKLLKGDLVISYVGTLGRVAMILEDNKFHLAPNVAKICVDQEQVAPEYLAQFLNSFVGQKLIFDAAASTTQAALSMGNLRNIVFIRPPLSEQRAIAAALSGVDGLLSGLNRLIAKKRDLKQAAMQQLLTGQTRLPGFNGEWEVKRLGEVADIRSGGTPSTTDSRYWNGDIPWCTPTDITALTGRKYLSATTRTITQEGLAASSAEIIPARSVVMTSRATIGECAINTIPLSTNQGFKNFVPFGGSDAEFLYYLLTTHKQGFISLCGGSTFLEIGKTQLSAFAVRLPAMEEEQTAIAAALSDMDAELAVLEARRDKTRALKQAMMQELLTGRTRLV